VIKRKIARILTAALVSFFLLANGLMLDNARADSQWYPFSSIESIFGAYEQKYSCWQLQDATVLPHLEVSIDGVSWKTIAQGQIINEVSQQNSCQSPYPLEIGYAWILTYPLPPLDHQSKYSFYYREVIPDRTVYDKQTVSVPENITVLETKTVTVDIPTQVNVTVKKKGKKVVVSKIVHKSSTSIMNVPTTIQQMVPKEITTPRTISGFTSQSGIMQAFESESAASNYYVNYATQVLCGLGFTQNCNQK